MSRFSVEIPNLPSPSEYPAVSQQINKDCQTFAIQKLGANSEEIFDELKKKSMAGTISPLELTLHNLASGSFWSVLYSIDGVNLPESGNTPEEMRDKRTWTQANFTQQELQQLLDLSVRTAIIQDPKTAGQHGGNWGNLFGHSLLYRQFCETPESMFEDAVTPDVRKKLNNGRFWEEIGVMTAAYHYHAIEAVNGVLKNYPDDLDPNFAPRGLEIFRRNRQAYNLEQIRGGHWIDLAYLQEPEVDQYIQFIGRIDQQADQLGLGIGDLEQLVAPYAKEVISYPDDYLEPGGEKYGELYSSKTFQERLQDGLVSKYLHWSSFTQKEVALKIAHLLDDETAWGHVGKVLAALPNVSQIFQMVTQKMFRDPNKDGFLDELERSGIPAWKYQTGDTIKQPTLPNFS